MSHKPLSIDSIKARLDTKSIGSRIIVHSSTTSTNDIAAEYAKGGRENHGMTVFAESQSAGRGRRGNKWFDADGMSILCSVVLFDVACSAELLTLAVSVAMANAIESLKVSVGIKWPNDIIINGKKAGGILLEGFSGLGNSNNYIIGVGINCCQSSEDFDESVRPLATSIRIASGKEPDRNALAAEMCNCLERWLEIARKSPDMVLEQWNRRSTLLGQRVTVIFDRKKYTGNCIGVDPVAGLVLQLDSGGVGMFAAAQTSFA